MIPYLALLLSTVLVVADQLLKVAVQRWLQPVGDIPLIDGVLHLTYLENRGMAFGMMEGQKWLLIWVTALVLLALIAAIMMEKIKKPATLVTVAVIIGGGVGNLIDRIYRSYVIDFIYVKVINFAIFNFADICVTCGTVVLLCILLREMLLEEKENKLHKAEK
jgi:signal peptidase II